jgi:hypothetical protein
LAKTIEFPQIHRLKRAPFADVKSIYKANRPTLI